MQDTRLGEGEEFNIEGTWREDKMSTSSQLQKRKKKGKLIPFFAFFPLLYGFFFFVILFFYLRRRRWQWSPSFSFVFLFMFAMKKAMMQACCHFFSLFFCCKQGDGNKLAVIAQFFFLYVWSKEDDGSKLVVIAFFLLLL